jgi:hypothetical protein
MEGTKKGRKVALVVFKASFVILKRLLWLLKSFHWLPALLAFSSVVDVVCVPENWLRVKTVPATSHPAFQRKAIYNFSTVTRCV